MDALDREVLALRHFEEMANHEVAAHLGIEQKAASIRYVRALRRLKNILSELRLDEVTRSVSRMAIDRADQTP
jgi:RNA polymerase sigma-70 factor (ECF subfamily)